jgi:hypothetical protein
MGCHRQPCQPHSQEIPPIFEAPVRQSRKAVNGRLRLTVYGRTRTVPVPYEMVSQCLTARGRNRIYGPCLRNLTARLQALGLTSQGFWRLAKALSTSHL